MHMEMTFDRKNLTMLALANSLVWCFVASEGALGALGLG